MQGLHTLTATIRNLIGRADLKNLIQDFVKKGLLDSDVQFSPDGTRDVVLENLLSVITQRIVDGNYISKCLCALEDIGVCVHFENIQGDVGDITLDLPACCKSKRSNQETAHLTNDKTKSHNVKSSSKDIVQHKEDLPSFGRPYDLMGRNTDDEISVDQQVSLQSESDVTVTEDTTEACHIKEESQCFAEFYRNTIIGNWKFLKGNLNPDSILENLISEELFESDDYDRVCESSRSNKISFMLTCIVRSIENADDFNKLINILETTKNGFVADKLKMSNTMSDWANKVETWIPKQGFNSIDLCRHLIEHNRNLIEKELKRPHLYVDDFLQNFIIDIDEHEQFFMSNDKSRPAYAAKLIGIVLSKLEKGSFQMLMRILEDTCKSHAFKAICKALDETPKKSEKRLLVEVKIIEETSFTDIKDVGSIRFILQAGDASAEQFIRNKIGSCITKLASECGSYVAEVKDGSVIVHLKAITSSMKTVVLEGWRTGEALKSLMDGLFSNTDFLNNLSLDQFTIAVTVEIDNNGSENEAKKENNLLQQRSMFKGNRNFLLEEIDPVDFLDAYSRQGFCNFDALDLCHIPERKLRAEKFLNFMLTKPEIPEEVFLDILKEKKMNFVLKRLVLFRRVQLIDPKLLAQSIRDNISTIAEELYIDDVKTFFVQNDVFQEDLFEELYIKYPENSETRTIMFMIKVLQAGESALYTFIDALFNSDIDMSLLNEMFNVGTLQTVDGTIGHEEDGASEIIHEMACTQILLKAEIIIKVETKGEEMCLGKIKNRFQDTIRHLESVEMVLSKMRSHIEELQCKLELPKRHLIEIEQNIFSEKSLVQLDTCKAELISINNELENVCQMQGKLLQHDDDAKMNGSQGSTGIQHIPEKTLQGSSNNSILPNILTDVAANNIFEDGCEIELKNTINVNNESQYKFPPFEASETQELVDNDIINIEDPDDAQFKSFDSPHLTHSIVRHLSRNETEVLPEITIRTIDGKIKHIKEKYITMDAGGKLNIVPFETKDKISEKSSEMTFACIPASTADESTEKSGASSKISFKDILRIKMTKQGWKDLCQNEARKGRKITLKELPQVCAPDTILLLDISGSIKGNAYKELKDAAYHFINKRSETRTELEQDENIAMVTFGHKTEVRHHLTSDYSVVENHLERLPEPGGPSPLVVGLKLCKSVIDARGKVSMIGRKRIGRKIVGGSRFHPRIILISDGNLTPTECVVGNKNLPDLNTSNEQEMSEMIDELYDICTEFKNKKVHIDCIPVGCYDETRLKFISECTGGKLLEKERAATLGNERLKMVYAKQIEEGQLTEDELKSKLLSMKAITAEDFDEITDMAKNPTKYGVANNDDSDSDDDEEGAEGVNIINLLELLLLAADDDFGEEDEDTPHFL